MGKSWARLCCLLIMLCPLSSYAEDNDIIPSLPQESHIAHFLDTTISEEAFVHPQTMNCDLKMLPV